MQLKRAYSLLEIKSIDEAQRVITGIASTPEPDAIGDVMDPKGAQFKLPMPLLFMHKQDQPIGEVFEASVQADGIHVKARIAKIAEPGALKDRIDMAWQSIANKLVRGFSIGWSPIEEIYDKLRGGFTYPKWSWYELSAVTVPMNADCTIQMIKSLDVGLAAPGTQTRVVHALPFPALRDLRASVRRARVPHEKELRRSDRDVGSHAQDQDGPHG
jgi:hypothetical protein